MNGATSAEVLAAIGIKFSDTDAFEEAYEMMMKLKKLLNGF